MVGVWERQTAHPQVIVGIPFSPVTPLTTDWIIGLMNLQLPPYTRVQWQKGVPIDVSRNTLVRSAQEHKANYIFFLDSDVIPPPDIVQVLMAWKLPIISGVYWSKKGYPAVWETHPSGKGFTPIKNLPKRGLTEVAATSMGCCLTPDTIIYTRWAKPITEVKVGDQVQTHVGRFRKVARVVQHQYEGDLVVLNPAYLPAIRMTPEHPVLVHRYTDGWHAQWVPAAEVTLKDYVYSPPLKVSTRRQHIKRSLNPQFHSRTHAKRPWQHHLPRIIPADTDLMRLFGYYIAEGSAGPKQVRFSFGSHESEYISDVQNLLKKFFDLSTHTYQSHPSSVIVHTTSRELASLFKVLFGHGAHQKHLPPFYAALSESQADSLLDGWWRGDGTVGTRDERPITTVSKTLAMGASMMMRKFDRLMAVRYGMTTNNGRSFPYYHVTEVKGRDAHRFPYRTKGWLKLRHIGRESYKGPVFNLEVEDDNTYVAGGIAVHNCLVDMRVFSCMPDPWFEWGLRDPRKEGEGEGHSEDLTFCARATQHGFKLFVDPELRCLHETVLEVDVEGGTRFGTVQKEA